MYKLMATRSGTTKAAMQPNGGPVRGNTRALVHAQFPKVVLWNFQTVTNPNAVAMRLTTVEAARLSKLYYEEGGDVPALMTVFAKRLNATSLFRMKMAFDPDLLDKAVATYAPAATQSAYFANGAAIPLYMSASRVKSMGLNPKSKLGPSLDYSLYEIYLDYRTGEMALSARAALAASGMYAGAMLYTAWQVGYATGHGIYYVTDQLAPSATEWLGDEIGGAVDSVFGNAEKNVTGTATADFDGLVTLSWGGSDYSVGGAYDTGSVSSMDDTGDSDWKCDKTSPCK